MANRKKAGKKKETSRRSSKNSNSNITNIDITFILLVLSTIILTIVIYGQSGTLSKTLDPIIGGIFGPVKYIVPIGTGILSIVLLKEDKRKEYLRIMQYFILISLFSSLFTVYDFSSGALTKTGTFSETLISGYTLGSHNRGGGFLGSLIAGPFVRGLGEFGATILILTLILVAIAVIFNISPTEYVGNAISDYESLKKDRMKMKRDMNSEEMPKYEAKEVSQIKYNVDNGTLYEEKTERPRAGLFSIFKGHQQSSQNPYTVTRFNNKTSSLYNVEKDGGVGGKEYGTKPEMYNEKELRRERIENEISAEKDELLKPGQMPPEFEANDSTFNNKPEDENVKKIGQAVFTEVKKEQAPKTEAVMKLDTDDIKYEDYNYNYPPLDLLEDGPKISAKASKQMIEETANKLQKTLYSFGVSAKVMDVSVGPAITRYELKPAIGVKVSKISNLVDDIALNLAAETIRIEAPIPGKQAVGIELPNEKREVVMLKDIIGSREFENSKSKVSFALGKGVGGDNVMADIFKMPHLLVAGSTGSGKSVCVNSIVTSIIYKADPNEVKFLMVDPKIVELSIYNSIPHLLIPVITEPMKAAASLRWAVQEMIKRYNKFAENRVKDIDDFNDKKEKEERMPKIIILIDELADLMMVAAKEVEDSICRIAQMGRAAGMHLVIATQRPSVDVITGLIKANIPSRIAFAVSSSIDSRTILDMGGAEKLLGKGDMLYYPIGETKPKRVQGTFISASEIGRVVDYVKRKDVSESSEMIEKEIQSTMTKNDINDTDSTPEDGKDPLLIEAIETVVKNKKASISLLRRKFRMGDSRAGRIIDDMERMGIVSTQDGNKPRDVLISEYQWAQMKESYENGDEPNQKVEQVKVSEVIEMQEQSEKANEEKIVENKQIEVKPYHLESVVNNQGESSFQRDVLNHIDVETARKQYEETGQSFEEEFINDIEKQRIENQKTNFKISRSSLNINEQLVEYIIELTEEEPYFMDAIEDMIEDDEISVGYLRRMYRINEKRANWIINKLNELKLISASEGDRAVVTVTHEEWDKINQIFMKLTEDE